MLTPNIRPRPVGAAGQYSKLHGERRLSVLSGAQTVVAAGTTTAGHVFAFRNPDTTKKVLLRYLAINVVETTALGAAQLMGYDVIAATGYTASHTGGTSIDVGSTIANSQKIRSNDATSCLTAGCVRIGTTGALTAGTHTLHANPLAQAQQWMAAAVGTTLSATFLDARDDGDGAVRSAWEFGQDEGFVIRNVVLQGATGVFSMMVTLEWDEVSL